MEFMLFMVALVVALLLTLVFASTYRGDGGWAGLWVFFILIFLFAAAGGIWTAPYGPVYWGVPWFGIIVWGVLIALLLAALATPSRPRTRGSSVRKEMEESEMVLGVVFWVLLALLVLAIAWGLAAL